MSSSHGPGSEVAILSGVPVLVVEDSWHVAKAMKSALEQLGMCVVGLAATTEEARHLVARQKPKMALVDVNLTKELASGLIEELHAQGVQVIVVSGYAMPPLPKNAVAAFLPKPFSDTDLITILCATAARLHDSIEHTTRRSAVAQPLRRYVQSALKSVSSECEVDLSPKFVGDEIANDLHSIPGCVGRPDGGPTGFLPFDTNPRACTPVRPTLPTNQDPSIVDGQRPVLCGIGRQLMQDH